jgi:hypothetical protein
MKFLNTIPTWAFIAAGIVLGILLFRWYKAKKTNASGAKSDGATAYNSYISDMVSYFKVGST